MSNNILIVLKGTSCSGKSTFSKKLLNERNLIYLSSDDIAERVFNLHNKPNTKEVFQYLNNKLFEAVDNNEDILIDATTLLPRYDKFYNNTVKNKNYKTICICFDLDEESIVNNIKERHNNKWSHMSIEEIFEIVNRQKKSFTYPNENIYDKVFYINKNSDLDIVLKDIINFLN